MRSKSERTDLSWLEFGESVSAPLCGAFFSLSNESKTMDSEKTIADIAEKVLGIETLETRRMDSLDFYEVAVWSVREALQQAYEAGKAAK